MFWDFPGGPVVKNLPAKAGDVGSIPVLEIFHMARGGWAYGPQLLKPACPRACAPQEEKPPRWEARAPRPERACARQQRPSTAKRIHCLLNALRRRKTGSSSQYQGLHRAWSRPEKRRCFHSEQDTLLGRLILIPWWPDPDQQPLWK